MSTMHSPSTDADWADSRHVNPIPENAPAGTAPETDGWVPDDREPSAAENNFMSFALFGFLILFGISCFMLF